MSLHPTFIVIDDHPLYRQGVMTLISQELHLECVGEAGNISDAIELLTRSRPQLALVDISLQNQSGLELIHLIKSEYPETLILVVSMHEENLYGERALKAGARGFVMKHENPSVLLDAVQKVLAGHIAVSEDLRQRMLESIVVGKSDIDIVGRLSDRELEVFVLIGKGYGATEIAERLHISVKTVNAYRDHIKDKLCLSSAADLRKFAVEWVSQT
ncbi:MAG: response regulator transcription factor [Spirochaetaceae bacterium]|nr:response regulator transcription factor [Spirochaetaceae bacterium]